MMNTGAKKVALIALTAFVFFAVFKKLKPLSGKAKKSGKRPATKVASEDQKKNAVIAMKAYSDAKKAGENQAFLDDMNVEFAKEFGLRVYNDRTTGKLVATDLDGTKIM